MENTEIRRNLDLAFLAYLGVLMVGPNIDARLRKRLERVLGDLSETLGEWKLVWGPCTYRVTRNGIPDNTMFVAESPDRSELVVSIAGTNPLSLYGWLVEDFDVRTLYRWPHGAPPKEAMITEGTLRGLRALQQMVVLDHARGGAPFPGANTSLQVFLRQWVADRRAESPDADLSVTVTGHSLGGALSPVVALWLADTIGEWDPAEKVAVSCWAYAGPTPGNAAFARYITRRMGGRLYRVANSKDVVPHAWNLDDLVELKALYVPGLPRNRTWDRIVGLTVHNTAGTPFQQIARPEQTHILTGAVNDTIDHIVPLTFAKYAAQATYQHTAAYFELLDAEPHEDVQQALNTLNRASVWGILAARVPTLQSLLF